MLINYIHYSWYFTPDLSTVTLLSKWEFLCNNKNLITNISIHGKHLPKASDMSTAPKIPGKDSNRRSKSVYNFRCSTCILSSNAALLSLALKVFQGSLELSSRNHIFRTKCLTNAWVPERKS